MNNIRLSVITLIAFSSMAYAGGAESISIVTPYEVEDVQMAEEAYVEPYVESVIEPEPIVEAPAPIPVPIPVPVKDINPSGFYAGLGIAAARYEPNCNCPKIGSGVDKTAGVMEGLVMTLTNMLVLKPEVSEQIGKQMVERLNMLVFLLNQCYHLVIKQMYMV